ncbi:hypothetical protein RJ639_041373 [Escallonia herrerae]|uniref:Retrotransposon gag domain-containing protein n=1 Tax=Escallonia herrerae TaxID=1293975 RepID=A0AA88WHL7_9ASTE|nr:hypothetical protein RJ639_041373 [Escallonia herrerae]
MAPKIDATMMTCSKVADSKVPSDVISMGMETRSQAKARAQAKGKEDAETSNAHKGKNEEVSEGETSNANKDKNKELLEGEDSNKKTEPKNAFQLMLEGSIPVDQLREFIMGTIKDKLKGPTKSSLTYAKPYTQKIDLLRMPIGYQPPKFQQFNGQGNPKQHIAHFVETCNNAGTYGDHLVKRFVRSLKGNAFVWYTDLQPHSINSWEQLEQEFLKFTPCTVSMIELTNSCQWIDEPVIDYINRWKNLSLNCKDRVSESSAIEMCIQGMQWGLQYILQGMQPKTFEDLATSAHDMELSIAAHENQGLPIQDFCKSKENQDARGKPFLTNSNSKESMVVDSRPFKLSAKNKKKEVDKGSVPQEKGKKRLSLQEMQDKEYPFLNSDVSGLFDDLISMELIDLPEMLSRRVRQNWKKGFPKWLGQIQDYIEVAERQTKASPWHEKLLLLNREEMTAVIEHPNWSCSWGFSRDCLRL